MSAAVRTKPDWNQWEGEIVDGEFPLERFLGAGDNGAVFRTRLASGEGAIKLVPAGKAQADELLDRWNRARALDHPHLIRILRTGTWSKAGVLLAYLVMEYADENLATVLLERPLTADETLEMLPPVAEALAFLHRQGLVHGRLQPSHIFAVKDTLKISSDRVSVGDASADLRALAATTIQVLTQEAAGFPASGPETALIYNLAPVFQQVVRNCGGQNGRDQWSAAELSRWLRSQGEPGRGEAARASRFRITKPKLTQFAIVFALMAVAIVTVGSLLRHRTAGSISAVPEPSAATPVQTPSASPPALPSPARVKAAKSSAAPREAAPRLTEAAPRQATDAAPRQATDAPDQVVRQVLPEISDKARRTVHGKVIVVVGLVVDQSGHVTDASLESHGSPYFGKLAVEAARKWVFVARNTTAPQEWRLRFELTRTDLKVFPQKTAER